MMIATITRTMPATIAIFAVFERLFRCGCGNCGAVGAPFRPAFVSATIFATSDFNFSLDFAVDSVAGLARNWFGFDCGDDCASAIVASEIISTHAAAERARVFFICFLREREG